MRRSRWRLIDASGVPAIDPAPDLVLPKPRPALMIQVAQSPSGASCFGRAQNRQSHSSSFACSSVSKARAFALSASGSEASNSALDNFSCTDILDLDGSVVLAGVDQGLLRPAISAVKKRVRGCHARRLALP